MTIADLQLGDELTHVPTGLGGKLRVVNTYSPISRLLIGEEAFNVTDAGLKMWWDVTRDGVMSHEHTHDVAALKLGFIVEREAKKG